MPSPSSTIETCEADVAEKIADCLEGEGSFQSVDWNDLGEVTVRLNNKTFRMTIHDITNEGG